jgi:hypothetical protein
VLELNVAFGCGGVPLAVAERGLGLFATEVLPMLHSWRAENAGLAAE